MGKVKEKGSGVREQLAAELAELQWALARKDFREFLKHVKVEEPPPGRGAIAFEFWPHLEEMIEALGKERLVVWLKARRNGASWLIAAYVVFLAQRAGSYFPLASQGEKEAIELLRKVRFVWSNLPKELKWEGLTTDSRTELKWGVEGSHIEAMPSTGKASRGTAITLAVIDEADFHEYLDSFYYAVKPSVDESGGQLVMVSTSNHDTMTSLFKDIYRQAPGNGFRAHFHGWRARPGRDIGWYEARRSEYPDIYRFEKEFPESMEQALSPPRTLAAFNVDILNAMRVDVRSPIEQVVVGIGTANIYQGFQAGKRYAAATDTSHGVGKDDAVTVVVDVVTGYVVADIQTALLPPEQMAEASGKLLVRYDSPVWAIEDNEWGVLTLSTALAMRYPRIYYREEGKAGWHTDERNRFELWGELIEAVSSRLLTVPSASGLGQFHTVIRNPDKHGRIEAQKGAHDDYPLAVGIAWQIRKHARPSGMSRPTERQYAFGPRRRERGRGFVRW